LLESCIELEPGDRPADAAALADQLGHLLKGAAVQEATPDPTQLLEAEVERRILAMMEAAMGAEAGRQQFAIVKTAAAQMEKAMGAGAGRQYLATVEKGFADHAAMRITAVEKALADALPGARELPPDLRGPAAALIDNNIAAMTAAAETLARSKDPLAWETLVGLDVGRPEIKRHSAAALDRLVTSADINAVSPRVAEKMIEVLGRRRGTRALEMLRAALCHANPNVRRAALDALEQRGVGPTTDEERRLRALVAEDWDELRKLGVGDTILHLARQLRDPDGHCRAKAVEALGKLGDVRGVEPLIAALEDEAEQIRGYAAEAPAKLGDRRAVPALIEALHDHDVWVRKRIAEALGKLGDPRALDGLGQLLEDLDVSVREAGVWAIAQIGGAAAVPHLTRALEDTSPEVRETATAGLTKYRGAEDCEKRNTAKN
jgi:HEAT repeat protein